MPHPRRSAQRRRVLIGYAVGAGILLLAAVWWLRPVWRDLLLYHPAVGDVVLQALPSNRLVDAIEGITGSSYSHCGIVDQEDGSWVVIEALGPVHSTPLRSWLLRGREAGVTVCRYPFAAGEAEKVVAAARTFSGRPYDVHYDLDDAKIYCSELVWKGFGQGIGVEVGRLERLGDLNWQPYTGTITYYEQGPVPLDRRMITPVGLTRDPRMTVVFDSFPAPTKPQ
jgi:hypothetical protein